MLISLFTARLRGSAALHLKHKHAVVRAAAARVRQTALFEPVLHKPTQAHAATAAQLRVRVIACACEPPLMSAQAGSAPRRERCLSARAPGRAEYRLR